MRHRPRPPPRPYAQAPATIFLLIPPGIPISVPSLVLSLVDLGVLAALYRQAEHQGIGPNTTASRV